MVNTPSAKAVGKKTLQVQMDTPGHNIQKKDMNWLESNFAKEVK
jgi:hypothetical protein